MMRGKKPEKPAGRSIPGIGAYISTHYLLYLMLLLPLIYYTLFHYGPMSGLLIAFKNYNMFRGIWASEWAGIDVFKEVLRMPEFLRSIRNTLTLNLLDLILGFPGPVILALMLNELANGLFKKITQTILYMPHFISWVIIGGMTYQIFATNNGVINIVLNDLAGIRIPFMTNSFWWIFTYFTIGLWQSIGFSAIIYMAAITSIDQEIYEAARVDGCSRFRMMWQITLPGIASTIAIMFILKIGSMASIGFEKPLMLGNPTVYSVSDVLSTFVYRVGVENARFSVGTAVGLFQSVVNFILVISANKLSNKITGESVW
jgi:putative aldouronate transport system permease protein